MPILLLNQSEALNGAIHKHINVKF